MKNILTRLALALFMVGSSLGLCAQNCNNAIRLTSLTNFCSPQKQYNNNSSNTTGASNYGGCFDQGNLNNLKNETWFKFTAVGTEVSFTVKTNGADGTIKNPNLTLHESCTGTPLACTKGTTNNQNVLYYSGGTTGKDYYIRVITTTGDAGTFTICIDNKTPPPNPQADCDKAVRLCDKNPVHLTGLSGTGTKTNELVLGQACVISETNSCWYFWKCSKSGTLTFDLAPNDGIADMDFIVFSADNQGDLCYEFGNPNKPDKRKVERCSATNCPTPGMSTGLKGNPGQTSEPSGCNTTPKDDGYVDELKMVAGKWYMLFIINANSKEGFKIEFGGTGEFEGPTAKIHADKVTICEGNAINFDKSGNLTSGYDQLEWTFTGGTPATATGDGPHKVIYDTPGNYVAVLKSTGAKCVQTDYVNITVNEGATVSVDAQEICEGAEATLLAKPSVPGGTYKWLPTNETTSSIKVKPAVQTTYTVIYSLAGCDAEGQAVVTVNKKPEVTVNSENICPGSSVDLKATLKETSGKYTFEWAPGGEKTQTISVSPTVKTTYSVTVKSEEGCTGSATATVDINGKLSVNAGNDTTICKGGTVQFRVKPNGAGYTYNWTVSNSTALSDPKIYNPTAVITEQTTFSVTVVSDKGCTGDGKIVVSIDPDLFASVTPSGVSCSACDGKMTATATGGTLPYTYTWSGSSGCTTPTCSNLCQGSYTVTVKDKVGCIVSADTSFITPAVITLQTSNVQSICGQSNGSATVVASGGGGGFKYEWNDKNKQTTATAVNLPAGKYCVTVTDVNNCKQTECVDIIDKPGFTASVTSITKTSCFGVCDGTAEVNVIGAVAPVVYSWNTTPGAQTNFKATGLCAGDYVVTIKDGVGCQDTLHVKIIQPTKVIIDPLPVVKLCIGSSATLNASAHGGDGNYHYSWSPLPDTTASVLVAPVVSTDYQVTVKDGRGCISDPLTIKVVVNPPLKVTVAGNKKLCSGDTTRLTAIGSGGNSGPYTYTWAPAVSAIASSVTVKPTVSTTFTVTVRDECGTPAATDTIRILVNPIPQIKFTGDTLQDCNPLTTDFLDSTIVTPGVITNWKWDFGDGTGSDSKNPRHIFTTTGTKTSLYTVTLTVTSDNGCKSSLTKKDFIRVFPVPTASFEVPVSVSILNPTVHFINTSIGGTMWEWDFGDSLSTDANNTSTIYSPDHTYAEVGDYCVKLKVKNFGGCSDSTTKCFKIDPKFVLYIPNAFTPNADGDNDTFFAKGEYITEFEMRIFDRWGSMIFYSNDMSRGWNGKVNNTSAELCQEDVYVYQVRIKDNLNKGHKYVGKVTLIKGR
jgi:gliding motility-associated-like protein